MAQETGFVTEYLDAIFVIELENGSNIELAIDTGFNGGLLLPRKFVEDNSLELIGLEPVNMIEGHHDVVDVVEAKINWLDEIIKVDALVSEAGDCLIGTKMLAGSKLEIDYKNLTVKITK
jgi:clan AA aspartic protease